MAVSPKFSAFDLVDADYKEINGVKIPATILIPKNAKPGKHPLIVRWHGGCFITGHRMFPDWFGKWILDFAASKDAIIVTPDYRLLPEATGLDILQDVRDFFDWLAVPDHLHKYLPDGLFADLEHILVTGESAGGWLALQSALVASPRERISAVISLYPMVDMRAPWYTSDHEKQVFTPVVPPLDRSILRDYLAKLDRSKAVTSAMPPDRVPLVVSAMQQGAFGQLFGDDSSLYPMEMLSKVSELPPTWILHGTEDAVIPVEGSYKYEKALKETLPNAKLHVSYRPGDHGFDNDPSIDLQTDWLKQGLEFVGESWPKC